MKIKKSKFSTIGALVVFHLKKNPNYPLEKLTAEIKTLKPKSKWAKDKQSALEQIRWYKSAFKSGRLNKLVKQSKG